MIQVGIIAVKPPESLVPLLSDKQRVAWRTIETALDLEQVNGIIIFTEKALELEERFNKLKLVKALTEKLLAGTPLWLMGAGFLLLQKNNYNSPLALLDVTATKANYPAEFTKGIYIQALDTNKIMVKFYSTPWIAKVDPHVGVMSRDQHKITMVRQGNILVSVFVPGAGDNKLVPYFLAMITENLNK